MGDKIRFHWTKEYTDELVKLNALGMNDSEIAGRMIDLGWPITAVDVRIKRNWMKLPTNRPKQENRIPKYKADPIKEAHRWLEKRLVERATGFFLDGNPASLDAVMQATNRQREYFGYEQITVNPRWVVKTEAQA